jgi:plastocyanin
MEMRSRRQAMMLRVFALGAMAAVVLAPVAAWAEDGRGRGRGEVELRHHDDLAADPASDERGDDDEDAIGINQAMGVPPVSNTPVGPVSTVALSIVEPAQAQSWSYSPAQLNTTVGTTLMWTNSGREDHTVTSDDRTSFDSGIIGPGGTFSLTPTTLGTYGYHCALHPWMKATLTVTP